MKKATLKYYFVLSVATDETIAQTTNKQVAQWIASNYSTECVIRTSEF